MKNLNLLFYKTYYEKISEYRADHYDEKGKKDGTEFDYDLRKHGEKNKDKGKNDQIIHTEFQSADYTPCPIPDAQTFLLETTYPGMLIGTGYAHGSGLDGADSDINCGFSFDYVTGQPYLPGSSVKGILHSVFFRHPEAVMEYLADPPEDTDVQPIRIDAEQCRALEKSIFGSVYTLRASGSDADGEIFRDDGVDVFLDAVVKHGNGQGRLVGLDNITPHPSPTKNPIPVLILKILPKVVFEFRFVLKDSVIESRAGETVSQTFTVTAEQKRVLFRQLLELMGAGAKTNVGYGTLKEMPASAETPAQTNDQPQTAAPEETLNVGDEIEGTVGECNNCGWSVTTKDGKKGYVVRNALSADAKGTTIRVKVKSVGSVIMFTPMITEKPKPTKKKKK